MFLQTEKGRDAYLTFLRNLSVMAVLGFIGTVFLHGGLGGNPATSTTIVGCGIWAMAVLAAWFNGAAFLRAFRTQRALPEKARALADYPPIEGTRFACLKQTAKRWWSMKLALVECAVVLMFVLLGCSVAAIQAGYMALPALHGTAAK
ncbi:hypothetical protein [Paraburkholderia atlantica]|uniref:hypothetical protein n=1 Tax=Paraburkholderia atlantica TaxID=2654982 RepID=UPI001610301B|nr:hypothetical protein [Paraburkholderia atlantica]MBB5510636.1 hypothetical protein [Paraburkholderia atlantica]